MLLKIWFYMGFWYAVRDAKVKYFAQTIHPYRAGRNATCNMRLYNTDKREYDKKCQCRKIHKTCIKGWLYLVIRQSDNGRSNRSVGQKKPWRNQCSQPIKKRSDLKNIVSLSTSVIIIICLVVRRPSLFESCFLKWFYLFFTDNYKTLHHLYKSTSQYKRVINLFTCSLS